MKKLLTAASRKSKLQTAICLNLAVSSDFIKWCQDSSTWRVLYDTSWTPDGLYNLLTESLGLSVAFCWFDWSASVSYMSVNFYTQMTKKGRATNVHPHKFSNIIFPRHIQIWLRHQKKYRKDKNSETENGLSSMSQEIKKEKKNWKNQRKWKKNIFRFIINV